jgi:hypothetical protein
MRSDTLGQATSAVEVTNISTHGFWLLLADRELFIPFAAFPSFKDAPVGAVLKVELLSPRHLYWPDLDVDPAVDSIEQPKRFPLISRSLAFAKPSPHKS